MDLGGFLAHGNACRFLVSTRHSKRQVLVSWVCFSFSADCGGAGFCSSTEGLWYGGRDHLINTRAQNQHKSQYVSGFYNFPSFGPTLLAYNFPTAVSSQVMLCECLFLLCAKNAVVAAARHHATHFELRGCRGLLPRFAI